MEIEKQRIDRHQLVEQIKTSTKADIDGLVVHIIKEKVIQEKDPQKLYDFFSYIYDNIYHDIIFKKTHLKKQTIKVLEKLAMPIYEKSGQEQEKIKSYILNKIS